MAETKANGKFCFTATVKINVLLTVVTLVSITVELNCILDGMYIAKVDFKIHVHSLFFVRQTTSLTVF